MQFYISKNGEQSGPFTDEQLTERLNAGEISYEDLSWMEGMSEWRPLRQIEAPPVPPPVQQPPQMASLLAPVSTEKKNDKFTIWSLVLGIISLVGLFFVGIPAVICGHFGLSRIKKNPSLGGKGLAITGLITGYISSLIFMLALVSALTLPLINGGLESGKATQMLNNMKQVHLALFNAQSDNTATGDATIGYPVNAKLKSRADVKQMLVSCSYFKPDDIEKVQFDKMTIGNVSNDDPADTILLEYTSENGKLTVVVLKSGDGQILKSGQSMGNPPPRTPAFLE